MEHTVSDTAAVDMREVMMQFESLGNNCEVGIAQRYYKAEPIGLLRWAFAPFQKVMLGLERRFEGLGAPGSIVIKRTPRKEYMVEETTYGYSYHSFVFEDQMAAEQLLERETKRLAYLAGKLVEDLTEARKVFVIKRNQPPLPLHAVRKLLRVMSAYGPTDLLWVELADAGHPPGSVERLEPHLYCGRIDKYAEMARVMHTTSSEVYGAMFRTMLEVRA